MKDTQTNEKLRNNNHTKKGIKSTNLMCDFPPTDEQNSIMHKNQEFQKDSHSNLLKHAIMGIAYINEHDYVTFANEAFQDLVQYSLDELQQVTFSHLIYPADLKKEQALKKEMHEGKRKGYSLEQQYIRKDGELRWVSVHASSFQETQDAPVQTVVFAYDITAKKQYEQDLLETNSIKNKFFSIVAHDLRNPIESIKILTTFIEHELKQNNLNSNSIRDITSLLSAQAEHTQKLLSNLLKWSQAQTKQITFDPKQLNIQRIVSDQIKETSTIAANKKIALKHNIDKDIWIEVDHEMLKIILRNLMANAIKFSYAESTVWIKVYERSDDVLITVEDQGMGIHPIIFEKLFHPDSKISTGGTQNERGTGLGLLLCKEFVEYHGGKIWAESSLNKGSKFLFTLPKHQ